MAIRYDRARIQEFLLGRGGGASGSSGIKKALTMFFFFFFLFFRPQLILQNSSGYFQRKLSFSKVPVGVDYFPGVQLFPEGGGGSNCLFPIETHITCDFPGSGPPASPTPSGSAHVIPRIVV